VASDFDADATSDMTWRNAATGNTVIWRMNGLVKDSAASIGKVSTSWGVQQKQLETRNARAGAVAGSPDYT
jgi:hypothetical protein